MRTPLPLQLLDPTQPPTPGATLAKARGEDPRLGKRLQRQVARQSPITQ